MDAMRSRPRRFAQPRAGRLADVPYIGDLSLRLARHSTAGILRTIAVQSSAWDIELLNCQSDFALRRARQALMFSGALLGRASCRCARAWLASKEVVCRWKVCKARAATLAEQSTGSIRFT